MCPSILKSEAERPRPVLVAAPSPAVVARVFAEPRRFVRKGAVLLWLKPSPFEHRTVPMSLAQAHEAAARLEGGVEEGRVTSPADGWVLRVLVEPDQIVEPGAALVELLSLS